MTQQRNLQAVILAAGNAVRMRPISEYIPKACLPVGQKMIIEHQLEYLKDVGIDTVHIVVGHREDQVRLLIGDGRSYGVNIIYHYQSERLGIAHALSLLENDVGETFMLLLGDIYFQKLDLKRMYLEFQQHDANAVLAASIEDSFDILKKNYSISFDSEGFVSYVVEKPTKKINNIKGAGAYIFDKGIFKALAETPASRVRNEVELTDAIQVYINQGARVCCVVCVEGDVNISTPAELLQVNMEIIREQGKEVLFSTEYEVGEAVTLCNVVVGKNSKIETGANLKNCVVLPNSKVREGHKIFNAVCYDMNSLTTFPS